MPQPPRAKQEKTRFGIDPETVAAMRANLLEIARGVPIAEAAVEGYSDWEVVEAMERLWTAATADTTPLVASVSPSNRTPQSASSDSSPDA